ncbi:hypothetical protein QL285_098535 [Trifolium repens]|nr:hypothetical protein QL285_098535 [Trifolium repens]
MLRIKEIQASGLIEDEPTRNAPNLGQVTSGSIQSGASPYIQGHTLQGFKVKNSLNSYPARIQSQELTQFIPCKDSRSRIHSLGAPQLSRYLRFEASSTVEFKVVNQNFFMSFGHRLPTYSLSIHES